MKTLKSQSFDEDLGLISHKDGFLPNEYGTDNHKIGGDDDFFRAMRFSSPNGGEVNHVGTVKAFTPMTIDSDALQNAIEKFRNSYSHELELPKSTSTYTNILLHIITKNTFQIYTYLFIYFRFRSTFIFVH